jgi:hypothetical protein
MATGILRVLVFRETGGRWTARALEHDIEGQARTLEDAVGTVISIARAHIAYDRRHDRVPLSAFAPAPKIYWLAYQRGTRLPPAAPLDSLHNAQLPQIVAAMVPRHPTMFEPLPVSWAG